VVKPLIEGVAMLVVAIAFAGCAASPQPGASIGQNRGSGDEPRPIFDVSGVWEGYLWANCTQFNPLAFNDRCNAMNKIAITMVQRELQITGFYKCRVGNMDCLNQNDSGTISNGSIENGLVALRIGMPDGSSCIFNGRPSGANRVRGNYTCYQGGGFVEHGRFEIARGY
jgi:hypothetical protein